MVEFLSPGYWPTLSEPSIRKLSIQSMSNLKTLTGRGPILIKKKLLFVFRFHWLQFLGKQTVLTCPDKSFPWWRFLKNRKFCIFIKKSIACRHFGVLLTYLAVILLTWKIWRALHNASRWKMGFNLAFKGLDSLLCCCGRHSGQLWCLAS